MMSHREYLAFAGLVIVVQVGLLAGALFVTPLFIVPAIIWGIGCVALARAA